MEAIDIEKILTSPKAAEDIVEDRDFLIALRDEYAEESGEHDGDVPQQGGSYARYMAQLCLLVVVVVFSAL